MHADNGMLVDSPINAFIAQWKCAGLVNRGPEFDSL